MQQKKVTNISITFRSWYEKKFNKILPLYIPSVEKHKLYAEYKKETGL